MPVTLATTTINAKSPRPFGLSRCRCAVFIDPTINRDKRSDAIRLLTVRSRDTILFFAVRSCTSFSLFLSLSFCRSLTLLLPLYLCLFFSFSLALSVFRFTLKYTRRKRVLPTSFDDNRSAWWNHFTSSQTICLTTRTILFVYKTHNEM